VLSTMSVSRAVSHAKAAGPQKRIRLCWISVVTLRSVVSRVAVCLCSVSRQRNGHRTGCVCLYTAVFGSGRLMRANMLGVCDGSRADAVRCRPLNMFMYTCVRW